MRTPPSPHPPASEPPVPAAARSLWRHTLRLTGGLLAIWLVVNLAAPWFARDLNAVSFGGFPLGYWIAAQGGLLVYLLLTAAYVWGMDRLERRYAAELRARPPTATGPADPEALASEGQAASAGPDEPASRRP